VKYIKCIDSRLHGKTPPPDTPEYMYQIARINQKYVCNDGCYHWHRKCVKCFYNRALGQYCGKNKNQYQTVYDYENDCDNFNCDDFKPRKQKKNKTRKQ
jgi:hypothetical protein